MDFNQRMNIVIEYYKNDIINTNTTTPQQYITPNPTQDIDIITGIIKDNFDIKESNKKEYSSKPCKNLDRLFSNKKRR